ncbi:MAG: hypothetical protein VKM34_07350 [Cyanobacteriota bacterium]|nr:hypothetical protein [Cyanobacteriota bacterium]
MSAAITSNPVVEHWSWHPCRLVAGYGVASGQAVDSPYPAGTIALQTPLFRQAGFDLAHCFPGTLNLAFPGGEWRLRDPSWHVPGLRWTDRHPPESFSFWPCRLRWAGASAVAEGWIYWPHPETKQRHHQPADRLEVLAPWIDAIATAERLELGVDGRRCRLIQPARLRARLLEFLKFRVLAAQESFFTDIGGADPDQAAVATLRHWLRHQGFAEAADLDDGDLRATLAQARSLYTD